MVFRYPGGKGKVAKSICDIIEKQFEDKKLKCLAEWFFGSGAITFELIKRGKIKKFWLNDYDVTITQTWNSILKNPKELQKLIKEFIPNVDDFYRFKTYLQKDRYFLLTEDPLKVALRKISIHQMSYSGLGTMAGGPIGGKNQKNEDGLDKKYKIDARWNPDRLIKKIDECNDLLNSVELDFSNITNYDALWLVNDSSSCLDLYYLDPPYYNMGNDLYPLGFDAEQHKILCKGLKEKQNWILSYDNCEEIREMYKFAEINELELNYSINNKGKSKELIISPYIY